MLAVRILTWPFRKLRAWWRSRRFVPTYDFYRLAPPHRILSDLPGAVQAPRGGIRYLTAEEADAYRESKRPLL